MKCIGLAMFRGYNLIDDTEIPRNVSIKWLYRLICFYKTKVNSPVFIYINKIYIFILW